MKDFYQVRRVRFVASASTRGKNFARHGLFYEGDNTPFFQLIASNKYTKARHCDVCGNVQIFTCNEIEENR